MTLFCPFCGSEVVVEKGEGGVGTIICNRESSCISSGLLVGFMIRDEASALKQWNTRYIPPEVQSLVEAVREIVSEAWGYGHLFDTPFHALVHDRLHPKLQEYEATLTPP